MSIEWFDPNKMIQAMKLVRQQDVSVSLPSWEPNTADIYYEEYMLNGTSYMLPMVVLKTKPCNWLQAGGGCTTCGYHLAGAWHRHVTKQNLLNQGRNAIKSLRSLGRFPLIHILSSGSFMDHAEVPDDICLKIFHMLQDEGISAVTTESRPIYLRNKEKLKAIREIFEGKITIGIGLETVRDDWRALCMNKDCKTSTYLEAIDCLREVGISYSNHVLLGMPFLTPKEAIEDAIATIRFSFHVGAEQAILMVVNLQQNTLTHWLWKRGLYQLPKLWAPLEVLTMLEPHERPRVVIKGIDKMIPEPL